MLRRLLLGVLLGLTLVASLAVGVVAGVGGLEVGAQTSAPAGDDVGAPCVVKVDCAGATVLVAVGLAALLPAALPLVAGRGPVSTFLGEPRQIHPAMLASRLYRPPRVTS